MNRRDFLKGALAISTVATLFNGCVPLTDNLKILIPLYSYPNWYDDNYTWQKLIDLKNRYKECEIIAIVNPNNGVFDSKNSDYERGIKDLINAKIKVVGYVYTSYGSRDKDDVKSNIDAWANIYKSDGVSGIFFDEVSTNKDDLNYYQDISNYAREKELNFIILNPGITTDQIYIDSNIANIVVSYENDYNSFTNNPPSKYNKPSQNTKLSLLIYEMDKNRVKELAKKAREHKFKYIYFTEDGTDGNPWDSISKYLEDEIKEAINKK